LGNGIFMMSKEIRLKILWSTIEDFVGLWEVVWELNSLAIQDNNQRNAIDILTYLNKNDFVRFYYSIWGQDDLVEIPNDQALKVLTEDKYWKPSSFGEKCVKVGSTIKGENYYNNNYELEI
jgi:hypothetical protein